MNGFLHTSRDAALRHPVERVEPALMFIDESGQLQAPRQPGVREWAVIGCFVMPDRADDRAALRELVQGLRSERAPDPRGRRVVKAGSLAAGEWDAIARHVNERWVFGHKAMEITRSAVDACRQGLERARHALEEGIAKLKHPYNLALEPRFAIGQLDRALKRPDLIIYLGLLGSLLTDVACWFRRNGILPRTRGFLDDKLKREDAELTRVLGGMMLLSFYVDVLGDRLREVIGVDEPEHFQCDVTSDHNRDGLVIADAIAYAAGRVARGQDPEGFYKDVLVSMSVK